jgi:alanine racemase
VRQPGELPPGTLPSWHRPVRAEVNLGALRRNAERLAALVAPAGLCAVVKADGYGHGAVLVAEAALAGGASWLAVATVDEGLLLRRGGIRAPVLVLSQPTPAALGAAADAELTPTLDTLAGVAAAAQVAAAREQPWAVQVKVDTGMHRAGCLPEELPHLVRAIAASGRLRLSGLWTHLAVADETEPEHREFTAAQLRRFEQAAASLPGPARASLLCHAANSAAALTLPEARYDLVRCGIALYGLAPSPALAPAASALGLEPALCWRAEVTRVQDLPAGARPSYGRRRPLPKAARVALVPVGYADGFPRRAFERGLPVLIGGRPRPLAGQVTMDQILVDCGEDPVAVGDEAVLLGQQGDASLTAWDWARTLGTIAYEVICRIGPRVPRVPVGRDPAGGAPRELEEVPGCQGSPLEAGG